MSTVAVVTTAIIGGSLPAAVLYAGSLVLVMWAVYDMARRPAAALPPRNKVLWIVGAILGWLLLGIVGALVAMVYLLGPRRRMNAQR